MLLNRKQKQINVYVFPGAGAAGHIIEPRKLMAHVTKVSGVHFTVHDLRRTFITIAESLDIPAYALKRLMNHKMSNDLLLLCQAGSLFTALASPGDTGGFLLENNSTLRLHVAHVYCALSFHFGTLNIAAF